MKTLRLITRSTYSVLSSDVVFFIALAVLILSL